MHSRSVLSASRVGTTTRSTSAVGDSATAQTNLVPPPSTAPNNGPCPLAKRPPLKIALPPHAVLAAHRSITTSCKRLYDRLELAAVQRERDMSPDTKQEHGA